jgi:GntR family transcriptional regulator
MYSDAESVEFVATEIVDGPEHVTEALQVPAGSRVARRSRLLRGSGGRPIELSTSWFTAQLAELAPRLLEPERLRGGTGKYIAEATGRVGEYARDQVAARLATAEERRYLDLPRPAAVLVYRLTAYDSTDRPVQFDEAAYPPDHWTFRQEYPLAR